MVDPISIIGLIVDIVPKVARYILEVKKGPKERRSLLDEILSTSGLLALIRDVRSEPTGDAQWAGNILSVNGIENVLQEVLELLQDLDKKLEPKTGISSVKQAITWPFNQADIENYLNRIARCKQNIMLAFHIQERNDTTIIHQDKGQQRISAFAEAQKLQNESEKEELDLEWLSTYDYQKKHAVTSTLRLRDTALWILNNTHFENWHIGSTNTLFCTAGPGHGKTIIASSIIDYLREERENDPTIALAYVYLDYKERADLDLQPILALLLRQIIRKVPTSLAKLHQLHLKKAKEDIKNLELREIASLLKDTAKEYRKLYIVIDAFDESGSTKAQENLTEHLVSLQELDCQIKILITSRTRPSTAADFHNSHILELQVYEADMRSYLEYRMDFERKLHRQVDKDANLRNKIVNVVVERCDGIFLLARLHMDSLSGIRTRADLEDDLANLPSGKDGLSQTYFEAMERIRSQDKRDVVLAERILAWLCFCARPLKVNELRYILTVNVEKTEEDLNENRLLPEEDILSLCGGLVLIDPNTSELRLVHHTTQEYFNAERHKLFPTAQKEIALSCIKFLHYKRFSRKCFNMEELEHFVQENPFLNYAAESLGHHCLAAGDMIMDDVISLFSSLPHLNCLNQVKHSVFHDDPRMLLLPSLTTAVKYKLTEVVRKMVAQGVNINLRGWSVSPAIIESMYFGEQKIIDILLAAKPDLRIRDRHANTVLHAAAVHGRISMLDTLLELCPENLNVQNANGNTPLHDAIGWNNPKAIPILLKAGADLCISNFEGDGFSPLFLASRRNRTEMVRTLLNAHTMQDKIRFQDKAGMTPLHIAAVYGWAVYVEDMLTRCPDVIDVTNRGGKTALHDAVERKHIDVVRVLIEYGADIDLKDNEGKTALTWAAEKGVPEVTRMLLEARNRVKVSE
jgi:ankyrin repeat protein